MLKKLALTSLMIFSLSACTSVELIHVPVGCMGQPKVSIELTQDEYDSVTLEVERKLIIFTNTLRARINAQCELNEKHDLNHSEN